MEVSNRYCIRPVMSQVKLRGYTCKKLIDEGNGNMNLRNTSTAAGEVFSRVLLRQRVAHFSRLSNEVAAKCGYDISRVRDRVYP